MNSNPSNSLIVKQIIVSANGNQELPALDQYIPCWQGQPSVVIESQQGAQHFWQGGEEEVYNGVKLIHKVCFKHNKPNKILEVNV